MKTLSALFLAGAFGAMSVCPVFAQPARDIAQANNKFAFDLYSRLDRKPGNVFFSPYSISTALTMTYEGAHGKTADEMRTILYLPSDEVNWREDISGFIQSMNAVRTSCEVSTANALWAQKAYPFKADYLALVQSSYFAEARNLDFVTDPEASRLTINSWVLAKTKDRIKNLLPSKSITSDTRLVLTNAVYFKGKWQSPFEKPFTKADTFWLDDARSVQTAMMALHEGSFHYNDNDQAQILQLPYQGDDLSMLIVLPRSKDIRLLEKILNTDILKQWQEGMSSQKVNVYLPKFKFDADYQLKDSLAEMGMKTAFDGNDADFSGMVNTALGEKLYIGGVFHKAWIETNEEGTEAAAATAVVMEAGAAFPEHPPKEFRADHPFLFVIEDNKTGLILFMGRVSDPREK